jgi:5'(3')-deoxyribonucleotidase
MPEKFGEKWLKIFFPFLKIEDVMFIKARKRANFPD